MPHSPEEKFMRAAIKEAVKARKNGDYAIGAVIVKNGEIVASSPNRAKTEQDPTLHAELSAIKEATKILGHRHLVGCVMYKPMNHARCVLQPLSGQNWNV